MRKNELKLKIISYEYNFYSVDICMNGMCPKQNKIDCHSNYNNCYIQPHLLGNCWFIAAVVAVVADTVAVVVVGSSFHTQKR